MLFQASKVLTLYHVVQRTESVCFVRPALGHENSTGNPNRIIRFVSGPWVQIRVGLMTRGDSGGMS